MIKKRAVLRSQSPNLTLSVNPKILKKKRRDSRKEKFVEDFEP